MYLLIDQRITDELLILDIFHIEKVKHMKSKAAKSVGTS